MAKSLIMACCAFRLLLFPRLVNIEFPQTSSHYPCSS
jgi:hypothetical protein